MFPVFISIFSQQIHLKMAATATEVPSQAGADQEKLSQKLNSVTLSELTPPPDFIQSRQALWEKFKARYEAELADKRANHATEITIKAKNKDGELREVKGTSWTTTPAEIARQIGSKSWSETLVIAKVNGVLWDLERPLEGNAELELIRFDDSDEGKAVFWHSSAHILGEAIEKLYGGHLCYGPPIENGFYYDVFMCGHGSGGACGHGAESAGDAANSIDLSAVSQTHYPAIESSMKAICGERQPFERLELTKDELLEMFAYNQFKVRIIKEKITEPKTTVYRCGTLIDLCRGPHVRHTGNVKAFKVTKVCEGFFYLLYSL